MITFDTIDLLFCVQFDHSFLQNGTLLDTSELAANAVKKIVQCSALQFAVALHCITWYCVVFHNIALYCMVLCGMVLYGIL